jgi:hypothetical protein
MRPLPTLRALARRSRLAAAAPVALLAGAPLLAGSATAADAPPDTAGQAPAAAAPADPATVFARGEADTLRSNLAVAEALMSSAAAGALAELPPAPAAVVLVPASTEPAANLATRVITARLQDRGYTVHLDGRPAGTDGPVYEFRYRVDELALTYPDTGRRLGIWKTWIARDVGLVLQGTLVAAADGQVLSSQRVVRNFQDRIPDEHLAAVESPVYPFTAASPQESGLSRQLEEIVVLGTLVGLVAIYFANTE